MQELIHKIIALASILLIGFGVSGVLRYSPWYISHEESIAFVVFYITLGVLFLLSFAGFQEPEKEDKNDETE